MKTSRSIFYQKREGRVVVQKTGRIISGAANVFHHEDILAIF